MLVCAACDWLNISKWSVAIILKLDFGLQGPVTATIPCFLVQILGLEPIFSSMEYVNQFANHEMHAGSCWKLFKSWCPPWDGTWTLMSDCVLLESIGDLLCTSKTSLGVGLPRWSGLPQPKAYQPGEYRYWLTIQSTRAAACGSEEYQVQTVA